MSSFKQLHNNAIRREQLHKERYAIRSLTVAEAKTRGPNATKKVAKLWHKHYSK